MRIAVTGGKGGTGKSVVATALATELIKTKKVLLLDLDVECPNDHLLLSIKRKYVKDVKQFVPKFDFKKCIQCGKCAEACHESAIVFVKGKNPIFIPDQCIGCKACFIACPTGTISEGERIIGRIYKGSSHGVDLIGGELEIGYEESSPIVNAVKDYVSSIEKRYDYVIIDTAAGTHCNVISALMNADIALAVTEPTPLGVHDLKLITDLLKVLKVKYKVILNRSDIGKKSLVKEPIFLEIPYRKQILEDYTKGRPIRIPELKKVVEEIE